jgi:hypothetical protein
MSSSSSSSGGGGGGASAAQSDGGVVVRGGKKKAAADDSAMEDTQLKRIQESIEKSLPNMMYGYGDSETPLKSTAAVLGNMAIDFVGEMTKQMVALAAERGDGELSHQNLLFLVRDDWYQFDRAWELKTRDDELRKAREIALAKDEAQ